MYGCYLGGNSRLGYARVVYASFRGQDQRWAFLCQVGVGLPALPAVVQAMRKEPLTNFMAPPRLGAGDGDPPTLDRLNKELHGYFELGTTFTMIAGLLNVLAIWDAYSGPVAPEKKDEDDEDEDGGDAGDSPDDEDER